jgi:hypothetical protein
MDDPRDLKLHQRCTCCQNDPFYLE